MRRDRRRTEPRPLEADEGGLVTGAAVIITCLDEDETRDEMSAIECAHAEAPAVVVGVLRSLENTCTSSA